MLTNHRGIIQSPTGSGKSLIIYLIADLLATTFSKTLIVVPTIGLVEQMAGDFVSYGYDRKHIQTIQAGTNKAHYRTHHSLNMAEHL